MRKRYIIKLYCVLISEETGEAVGVWLRLPSRTKTELSSLHAKVVRLTKKENITATVISYDNHEHVTLRRTEIH